MGRDLRKRLRISVLYFGEKIKHICVTSDTQLLFHWFSELPQQYNPVDFETIYPSQ